MTKVDPQAAPEIAAFPLGDTLRNPLEPPSDSSIAIRVSLDVGGASGKSMGRPRYVIINERLDGRIFPAGVGELFRAPAERHTDRGLQ